MFKKSASTTDSEDGWPDPSHSCTNRNIDNLFQNLEGPEVQPHCLQPSRTIFVCSKCGCSYPNRPKSYSQKVSNKSTRVKIYCLPEKRVENGSKIVYFGFRVNSTSEDEECNGIFDGKVCEEVETTCSPTGCLCSQIVEISNGFRSVSKNLCIQKTSKVDQTSTASRRSSRKGRRSRGCESQESNCASFVSRSILGKTKMSFINCAGCGYKINLNPDDCQQSDILNQNSKQKEKPHVKAKKPWDPSIKGDDGKYKPTLAATEAKLDALASLLYDKPRKYPNYLMTERRRLSELRKRNPTAVIRRTLLENKWGPETIVSVGAQSEQGEMNEE